MIRQSAPSPASHSVLQLAMASMASLAMACQAAAPPTPVPAQTPTTATVGDTAITIYSSARPGGIPPEYYRPLPGQGTPNAMGVPGYAMVRQEREVQLARGRSDIRFTDVAALIDPTTVTFTSLTDPATRVLEQNFQFDLVSTDKLLLKFVDQTLVVERNTQAGVTTTGGTLLSSVDGLVLRNPEGGITALRDYAALRFPELPGGLITRPTLLWDISSERAGTHRARVTYQTSGVTWWADYNLIFSEGRDANNGFVDLSAWVSIINQSGATYPDARLKLIAGDVNRVRPVPPRMLEMAMQSRAADGGGFEEQSFDEFHLYTLGRRTTLPNNSTKQVELFDQARKVPAQRSLVYTSNAMSFGAGRYEDANFPFTGESRVDTYLMFRNDRASGLGMPLPAGRIRVSRLDATDSSLEFIGEDAIGHTPRDERVRVKLGSAFDVVGERKQVDFRSDSRARVMEEEIEVTLRNHKDVPVEVQVREVLFRWSNWQILSSSQGHEKEDARTILFNAQVPANGERTVRYRVRYSW